MPIMNKEHYKKMKSSTSMKNMRKLIDSKNCSIVKLAMNSGVSDSTINSYLNGQKIPSLTTLISIANYLNCNIDYLIGRTTNPLMIDEISNTRDDEINIIIYHLINLPKRERELVFAYIKGLIDANKN